MSLLSEGVVGEGVVGAWAIAVSPAPPSAPSPVSAASSARSSVALSSGLAAASPATDAGCAGGRNNGSDLTELDTLPHPASAAIRKEQPRATETRRRRPVTIRG